MARPKKNTIDYFPHPVKDGSRMYIMEQKYGDKGYCCYYKLLQQLGSAENHVLDFKTAKHRSFFSALLRATDEEMYAMLDTLAEIGTIDPDLWLNKIVWCQELVDSVEDLYTKRKRELPKKPVSDSQNPTITDISVPETPQSKVKDSKAKDSKLNESLFFLKINGNILKEKVSDHFKANHGIFYESWKMQNGSGRPVPDVEQEMNKVFDKMDLEYNGYDFMDENHIQNTFKSVYKKVTTINNNGKSNNSNSASIITPGKSWD